MLNFIAETLEKKPNPIARSVLFIKARFSSFFLARLIVLIVAHVINCSKMNVIIRNMLIYF